MARTHTVAKPRIEVSPIWTGNLGTVKPGPPQQVVGESHRQQAIDRLAGPKTKDGPTRHIFAAQLVADFRNPYDPNAVAVFIGRDHVGYIPRDSALQWRDLLADLRNLGLPAVCEAQIVGGWRRPEDEGHYGVELLYTSPPVAMDDAHLFDVADRLPSHGRTGRSVAALAGGLVGSLARDFPRRRSSDR